MYEYAYRHCVTAVKLAILPSRVGSVLWQDTFLPAVCERDIPLAPGTLVDIINVRNSVAVVEPLDDPF